MAKKTSTAPASAEKTAQKADKTIKKVKKVNHPWKNLRVAFVGPCIYQETAPRTIIMMEDEDSTAPLVKKMGAKFAGHGLSKAQVVVVGDQERMIKGEDNAMLKRVMKVRDARADNNPLLVCSFTTFLAEYVPCDLESALHRSLTCLEYHRTKNPAEIGKRNATSLATMLKVNGGKHAVKYNHKKHHDAAQHNLTNRRIEAAAEPDEEEADDGAEDAEAPSAVVDEPVPEDAKEEGNAAAAEEAAQADPDGKEAAASQS